MAKNAEAGASPSWPPPDGKVLVCLVENYVFTAAAVAYSEAEMKAFCDPQDSLRPKSWFLADFEKVAEVCPDAMSYFG